MKSKKNARIKKCKELSELENQPHGPSPSSEFVNETTTIMHNTNLPLCLCISILTQTKAKESRNQKGIQPELGHQVQRQGNANWVIPCQINECFAMTSSDLF